MEIRFSKIELKNSSYIVKVFISKETSDKQEDFLDGSKISINMDNDKEFIKYSFTLINENGENYLIERFGNDLTNSLLSMTRFYFRDFFEQKIIDFEFILFSNNVNSSLPIIDNKIEEIKKEILESTVFKDIFNLLVYGKNNSINNYNELVYLNGKSKMPDIKYNKFAEIVFNSIQNEVNIQFIQYLKKIKIEFKKRICNTSKKKQYSFGLKNKKNTTKLENIINKFQQEFDFLDSDKCNSSDLLKIFKSANFNEEKVKIYSGCKSNLFSFLLISLDDFFSNLNFPTIAISNCFYPLGKSESFKYSNLKTSYGNFKKNTDKIELIEKIIYEIKHEKTN